MGTDLLSKHLRPFSLLLPLFLLFLIVTWFVLNHYRALYYNDYIEDGPRALAYTSVVHAQNILQWPILTLAIILLPAIVCRIIQVILTDVGHLSKY
jgi:energy-coupling factor transporter transmembrane protein EcfT